MKIDLYTKFMLTIIAFCMIVNMIQPVKAKVQTTPLDVNIESIGGYRIYSQKLPVEQK